MILVAFVIATLAGAMLKGAPFERMIPATGATIAGVCYVVLLGGHLIALRAGFPSPLAAHLLTFFFFVLMGSDTAAYYTGRAFGRRKLAPTVSPGKTWEGAAGGLLASLGFAALAHYWFFPELQLRAALPLAAAMNVLGVVGDLTESALKRGSGAKDAARILPGHGGLLDRLDSLLFNAPLIYYFAVFYFADALRRSQIP
jgi:phosphatidate cytidylyltransferase